MCASRAKIHESTIYFFNALSASVKHCDYNYLKNSEALQLVYRKTSILQLVRCAAYVLKRA